MLSADSQFSLLTQTGLSQISIKHAPLLRQAAKSSLRTIFLGEIQGQRGLELFTSAPTIAPIIPIIAPVPVIPPVISSIIAVIPSVIAIVVSSATVARSSFHLDPLDDAHLQEGQIRLYDLTVSTRSHS